MSSRGQDRDRQGREQHAPYRDGVGPADPSPVTDAMITPRTAPDPGESGGPQCHVCGKANRASATYCLQCGSRLRGDAVPPPSPEPAPGGDLIGAAADDGWWDPDLDDEPWNRSAIRAEYAAEEEPSEPPDEAPVVERGLSPRARLAGWGLLAVVALALVVVTFLRGGDPGGDAESPTTLVTGLEAELYGALISEISAEVASLGEQADLINQRWDGGEADFQETLAALESLEQEMADLASRLRVEEVPDGLSAQNHTRLISSAGTLERAATGMVEGLKAPDTGEARRAEFARFSAAATEFTVVADTLLQVIDLESAGQ